MRAASRRTGRAPTTVEVRVSAPTRSPLPRTEAERLARAVLRAEGVRHAILSIAFVGRRRIRTLNRRHRGQDRATDVLAFSLLADARAQGPAGPVVGDVYVCAPVAVGQATRFGASPAEEVRRLLVHGVLHVLGYDHAEGPRRTAGTMWRRQEQLLARLSRTR
jgi:probable rRNA maturation factor